MNSARVSLAVALALAMGCNQSQVIATLSGVVSAVEVVLPIIGQAAGIPAATVNQVEEYLSLVNDAASRASTILATADTPAVKAARITAIFASIAVPKLPPGTPRAILDAVQQVAQAVAKFLEHVQPATAAANSQTATQSAPVSARDAEKLASIRAEASSLQPRIEALRK